MSPAYRSDLAAALCCRDHPVHAATCQLRERDMSSTTKSFESRQDGVIVGVDGSSGSRVAVDWAARDAELRDVPLTVVHALPSAESSLWLERVVSGDFWTGGERHAERVVGEALRWVSDAISVTPRIEVRHQVVAGAVPAPVDISKSADLVVVGCRGLGGVQGLLLGSVSSALVHHAHCQVAVIHDEDPLIDHPATASVVVGIDGSPASDLAVGIAFDEASRRRVDLVAVHTWLDRTQDFDDASWASLADEAHEALGERLAGYSEQYPDVVVRKGGGQGPPRPPTFGPNRRRPTCWWSAATAAVDSPACCWARSAPRWCTPPACR